MILVEMQQCSIAAFVLHKHLNCLIWASQKLICMCSKGVYAIQEVGLELEQSQLLACCQGLCSEHEQKHLRPKLRECLRLQDKLLRFCCCQAADAFAGVLPTTQLTAKLTAVFIARCTACEQRGECFER